MSDRVGSCEEPRGMVTPRESLAETLCEGPSRRPVWQEPERGQGGSARCQGGHEESDSAVEQWAGLTEAAGNPRLWRQA